MNLGRSWRKPAGMAVKVLGGLLVGSLALTACGTASSESAPASSTLVFGNWGGPQVSWDPHRDGGTNSNVMLFAVYDRLIGQKSDGTLIPGLASEWNFVDDRTLVLELREGVKFQDGTPFDATSVQKNFERATTINGGSGPLSGLLGAVASVETPDPYTAIYKLDRPYASLPALLSGQAGAMVSPAAFESDLNEHPVGAGMYRLESWTPKSKAVFVKFNDYWDSGNVKLDRIEMPLQSDQLRRLDALKAGQIDATYGHTSFVAGATKAGLDMEDPQTSASSFQMILNRSRAPFDNRDVRRAISHAINRDGLINSVLGGQASNNQQPFPEYSPAFDKDLGTTVYDYNPGEAKKLLAAAGFGDGLKFSCVVATGESVQYAEVVQASLKAVGVDMTIEQVDRPTTSVLVDKSSNCGIMPQGVGEPGLNAQQLFAAKGYYNPGGIATPEMEALLARIELPNAESETKSAYKDLVRYVMDEALFINLFDHYWTVAKSKDITGLNFYPSGQFVEFKGIEMK